MTRVGLNGNTAEDEEDAAARWAMLERVEAVERRRLNAVDAVLRMLSRLDVRSRVVVSFFAEDRGLSDGDFCGVSGDL